MAFAKFFKILHRDMKLVEGHTKTGIQLKWMDIQGSTVGKVFDKYARKHPGKVCFYFQNQEWTFKQVEETSNRFANYFSKEGFQSRDVISLFMGSSPDYVSCWLGLSKVGIITALINYNLRLQPLRHCIEVAKSKAVICSTDFSPAISDIHEGLKLPVYMYGEPLKQEHQLKNGWKHFDKEFNQVSAETPFTPKDINFRSSILYCYTSGTTGMPKAGIITNSRFFMASFVNHISSELTEDDRVYTTLPLYHVAGGMLGLSQTLVWGNSMIMRDNFSASAFWKDCYDYKATAAQYIAETCKYLLQAKESEWDRKHGVRVMFGNGFRRDLWPQFVDRFNIPKVTEFYASTEGNANLVNYDNTVGAVGVIPRWMEKKYPIALVKLNLETNELERDKATGFLILSKPGEVGELIGKIVNNSPFRDFKGYANNQDANEKKTVRNVFDKGDAYFRTGDLLYKDEDGYYYFSDRLGDTFRWKSENVATAEVESVISSACNLKDCIAFGVKIPHYDGAAGLAVIADPNKDLDMTALETSIKASLPHYARPLFIRITDRIPVTSTHKLQKTEFVKHGYDLDKVGKDKLWFLSEGKYVLFTKEYDGKIKSNQIKL